MNPKRHKLKKLLWLVSIARNALVVLAASTAAFFTYDAERPLFKLSGNSTPLSRSRAVARTILSIANNSLVVLANFRDAQTAPIT